MHRDAILAALSDPKKANWSDRRIAKAVGCSHPTVAVYRREHEKKTGQHVTVRVDKNRRTMRVAKIGRGHEERNWFRRWDAEWYTPYPTLALVREFFGGTIDLDPASCPEANDDGVGGRWARRIYTREQDGLRRRWRGRVYCNPPYAQGLLAWIRKARAEFASGTATEVILLVPHSPTSLWFHTEALPHAHICLLRRRLELRRPKALHREAKRRGKKVVQDNLWSQDLLYFGPRPTEFARHFASAGTTVACVAGT